MAELTSRLATLADVQSLTALMDAAIAELQREFLDVPLVRMKKLVDPSVLG